MSTAELAALAAAAGEVSPPFDFSNDEVRRELGFGLVGGAAECPR